MAVWDSARVSRAGERVLAIVNFPCEFNEDCGRNSKKDCFGATPKVRAGLAVAREARALPNHSRTREGCLNCKADGESADTSLLCSDDRPL